MGMVVSETDDINVQRGDRGPSKAVASVSVVLLLPPVAIFLAILLWRVVKMRKQRKQDMGEEGHSRKNSGQLSPTGAIKNIRLPPSQEQELVQELQKKNMLIAKEQLELGRIVGRGEFGLVHQGYMTVKSDTEIVAIKTLKALSSDDDRTKFLKEASVMLNLNHPNIMSLMGLLFDGENPLIIMPFMSNRNVLEYVRKNRDRLHFQGSDTTPEVENARKICLGICYQISKGMCYLASVKFVHRDLAARNCMIDGNELIKVADFGLAEDVYTSNYYRHNPSETERDEKMPIRWMAPETFETNIFNEKTDVWSFGVTCWEVFTSGGVPYAGIPVTALLRQLRSGHRLDRPSNTACSDDIWSVVKSCWTSCSRERKIFSKLVKTLSDLLDSDPAYIKFLKN